VLPLTLVGWRIKHLIQNVLAAAATSQSRLVNLQLQIAELFVIVLLVFSLYVALFLVDIVKGLDLQIIEVIHALELADVFVRLVFFKV